MNRDPMEAARPGGGDVSGPGVPPRVAAEPSGGLGAMSRSGQLAGGRAWGVAGLGAGGLEMCRDPEGPGKPGVPAPPGGR